MLLLFSACGGSKPTAPQTPTVTTPTASPTATPSSFAGSCTIGKGDINAVCVHGVKGSQLIHYVETAIDSAVREKPQLFDMTVEEHKGADTFRVLDPEAYLDAIVTNVQRQHACAQRDPDDFGSKRVLVKDANDLSEGFYVISDKGFIQRGGQAFDQLCTPASFPIDRTADMPPAGSGCGRPYPAPIHHFDAKVWLPGSAYVTLDSTAKVGPDVAYCAAVGYTDGRAFCPVRADHGPERVACEAWRVGTAKDTGRPGPTWTFNGHYCTGPDSGCQNHPDNQNDLWAYENGTYTMCGQNGACGSVVVGR
ncbi:MAG TPA: hypothetical protein VMX54_18460 [Vicinamibacteria bacterium]|nr:hypothetical protein [Vicinamibacteria bacterium]